MFAVRIKIYHQQNSLLLHKSCVPGVVVLRNNKALSVDYRGEYYYYKSITISTHLIIWLDTFCFSFGGAAVYHSPGGPVLVNPIIQ
jgi:hypothetical protein